MADSLDDEQYFARVEHHFGRRRGGPVVLSPTDWRLLERWRAQAVPLRVVLRGINQAFDRFESAGPRPDRINSLRYCEQEVQAAWQEHRSAHRRSEAAGASSALPGASQHLGDVAAACRSAATSRDPETATLLASAAQALDELAAAARAGTLTAAEIDERSAALERQLRHELLERTEASGPSFELPAFNPYDAT